MHALLHLVPPTPQQATADPHLCQRLLTDTPLGHSRASQGQYLVGSLLLSSGSWYAHSSVWALPESVSPVLCKLWWLYGGLMVTSFKKACAIPRSTASRAPALTAVRCWPVPPQENPNTVLSQSLWGLWVLVRTRFVWALWASLVGMGFDSKCDFSLPIVLLGLLLCLWMWGISSQLLQRHTATAAYPMLEQSSLYVFAVSLLNPLLSPRFLWPQIPHLILTFWEFHKLFFFFPVWSPILLKKNLCFCYSDCFLHFAHALFFSTSGSFAFSKNVLVCPSPFHIPSSNSVLSSG